MTDKKRFRVFATSRIGDPAENRLRERGYELEVLPFVLFFPVLSIRHL
jgi:hypothetical protein